MPLPRHEPVHSDNRSLPWPMPSAFRRMYRFVNDYYNGDDLLPLSRQRHREQIAKRTLSGPKGTWKGLYVNLTDNKRAASVLTTEVALYRTDSAITNDLTIFNGTGPRTDIVPVLAWLAGLPKDASQTMEAHGQTTTASLGLLARW
ncbi:hypothetical protein NUW58_g1610 [Xylaria curta]|uniref:Uncharacterized protein n=1 Tax=Xylaria curta TaxID=42375 RepID=A0ACC1PMM9_9PEZI|nr:hypothetical protein NUW58_g1610 [Xylaria curta]